MYAWRVLHRVVTGVKAAKHGICLNTVFDLLEKERRAYRSNAQDIRVPTVYQLARKQGLKTSLVRWPVSVGAEADWLFPEMWRRRWLACPDSQ